MLPFRYMIVEIPNRKLKRWIENDSERRKHFGSEMAQKIKLRMDALVAAESLAVFYPPNSGPERCHELKGSLSGTFSMDLKHPYRLLFTPVEDEKRNKPQNELQRWREIEIVTIVGIEDTHD